MKYTDPDGKDIADITSNKHQQDAGTATIGTSTNTIYDVGCVLTATVKIADSISGTSTSLETANQIAIENNLYTNGNELTIENQANLIGLMTGKDIGYSQYEGTESGVKSKLASLQNDTSETYYVSGRIHATSGDGKSKYDHQVNVRPFETKSGFSLGQGFTRLLDKIRIKDTSNAERTSTDGRVKSTPENMFRLNIFHIKEE